MIYVVLCIWYCMVTAGAIVGGTFDCFYFTGIAWICDFFPQVYTGLRIY